jgi:hypothetical protein
MTDDLAQQGHVRGPVGALAVAFVGIEPQTKTLIERKEVKGTLESNEFVDEAPATVYAKLLDQGTYLASVSTMYRVLHEHDRNDGRTAAVP